ncbi:MAG: FAD-dependent oxidoreductase [Gammaproteobacteria bacterium]|nr:FAD-dependent oxidoreductase [Gammaproteobacteria bacterium]MBT8093430.1 FAD-dependent oxidoreductase [Gammaproteobacteria bacterium]
MVSSESDILIVGAGIAGLIAAHECLENGRSVTLVERHDETRVGGLARTAFGGMALVGTSLQRRMGIRDTPELALSDWHSFAEFGADDEWPRRWAEAYVEQSADRVFRWLLDKDMHYLPAVNWVERGDFVPGNSVPRYHILWGTGFGLVERFVELLAAHRHRDKLRWIFGCRVEDLVESGGRIAGCTATIEATGEAHEFRAGITIVATGGINGNLDKVREHWPGAPAELLNGSHPFCDGYVHDVVAAHGGSVTHLENMWNYAAGIPHPQAHFDNHGLSLIPCKSALWLDHMGRRIGPLPLITGFDTHDLCRRLAALEKPWSWHLLNWRIAAREFAISGAEHNPHIRDGHKLTFVKETLLGNHRLVRQMQEESDHFIVADSLPELVERMRELDGEDFVKFENVEHAAREFDDNVRRGPSQWNDDQLRRIQHARAWRSDRLRTCRPKPLLDHPPLIAIKLRLITRKSLGGIRTDLSSRVLAAAGEAIPGLYAVGEAAGFGGGGVCGKRSLEGTFLSGCVLTARAAADAIG